jgi:SnoaL-like domain
MHPDVEWANGMDGGFVQGREAVRDYWTRQWRLIDPHVEPRRFVAAGRQVVVDVHQIVRDLAGRLLKNQHVRHAYVVEAGLIRRMEIRSSP